MKRVTRRGVLGRSLTGAAGLAALGPSALLPASAVAATPVSGPARPMVLTRILERELRGGTHLRVERSWQVQFTEQGRGLAITGNQIAVAVAVPPHLASLAKIEEERSTAGMFPILLSDMGEILTAGRFIQQKDLVKALKVAEDIIEQREHSAAARAHHAQFLSQLQQAGASLFDQLPRDLFFPKEEPQRAVRQINLPDGATGEFELSYEARRAPRRDWLEHATRRVITRIGSSEKRSSEEWLLSES